MSGVDCWGGPAYKCNFLIMPTYSTNPNLAVYSSKEI